MSSNTWRLSGFPLLTNFRRDRHVVRAAQNAINLDERQANAVAARIELDLRIGYAFTRFNTLTLQAMGGHLSEKVISYGQPWRVENISWITGSNILQDLANFQPWASL